MVMLATRTTSLVVQPLSVEDMGLFSLFLEEGLAELNRKIKADYLLNDLIEECSVGATTCLIVADTFLKIPVGFFALTVNIHKGFTSITISSAYATRSISPIGLKVCLQKAVEFAIIVGAREVEFYSPRRGWKKIAINLGFNLNRESDGKYHFIMKVK